MKVVAPIFLLPLAACVSFPPEHVATAAAMELHGRNAPVVRYEKVDGVSAMFSRDGIVFLDGPVRVSVVSMIVARKKERSWPAAKEIVGADETWRASPSGDYLLIERLSGQKSHISRAYITPDAFVSVDEKMLPLLHEIDQSANGGRRAPAPIMIIK